MERKFETVWKGSYVPPATEVIDLSFFNEENRYDEREIKRIQSLAVSQSLSFDQGDHIVIRIE